MERLRLLISKYILLTTLFFACSSHLPDRVKENNLEDEYLEAALCMYSSNSLASMRDYLDTGICIKVPECNIYMTDVQIKGDTSEFSFIFTIPAKKLKGGNAEGNIDLIYDCENRIIFHSFGFIKPMGSELAYRYIPGLSIEPSWAWHNPIMDGVSKEALEGQTKWRERLHDEKKALFEMINKEELTLAPQLINLLPKLKEELAISNL